VPASPWTDLKRDPTGGEPQLDLEAGLRRLGYESFRRGQREAIETLLAEGRLLLVAPTGGGKSLSYQLPAAILTGTTLVVSPLISLMQDQVTALEQRGIAASFLASTIEPGEMRARMSAMARGRYEIVYVAPERLAFAGFRSLIADIDCPLVAVDEAHCISEWGHDFRPEYLQIDQLLGGLPAARVLACTATATPVVRDEILERLGLPASTCQLVHGFARPNLALRVSEVRSKHERNAKVDAALDEALGGPDRGRGAAIVYSPTRKAAEAEHDRLAAAGFRSMAYHAGMNAEHRSRAHSAFSSERAEVIVATNAFGMGIDRPDVRAVIHLAPPGSIESYYQEVGRAGRDGNPALGLLLISPGDMARRRYLIESDGDGVDSESEIARHKWNLFLELMRFAEGGSCRHDALLRYFGDEEETLAGCGHCDVCRRLESTDDNASQPDPETVSLIVRKGLSAVARVHERFGLGAAVKLLRGADDPRLARTGLERTRTFGALADRSEEWLTRLLRRCVTAGWVDFRGGERPVVVLTEDGRDVMHGRRPARLLLPPATPARGAATTAGRGDAKLHRRAATEPEQALDTQSRALFEALRVHRLEVARREGVPPYVVASDRTLRDLAALRPRDPEQLLLVYGIGPTKVTRYGAGLLEVIRNH
jgi:ATP-dependent DNA helicase RecQ